MHKFIMAVAVLGLTACSASSKTEEAPADSTSVVAPTDTVVITDSVTAK